jgi:hypothetical protein
MRFQMFLGVVAFCAITSSAFGQTNKTEVKLRVQCDGTVSSPTIKAPQAISVVVEVIGDDTIRAHTSKRYFNIIDPRVSEDAIYGQIRFGVFYKPSFKIDRQTGSITLSDSYGTNLNGVCHKV